jgi:hypothetical protein
MKFVIESPRFLQGLSVWPIAGGAVGHWLPIGPGISGGGIYPLGGGATAQVIREAVQAVIINILRIWAGNEDD